MRSFVVIAMFTASLASAGWNDYEEVRELSLDANGIEALSIKAGAGSMDVQGIEGADRIEVKATIIIPGADKDEAQGVIDKKMVLELDKKGNEGRLNSWFENSFMGLGTDAHIVLEVSVPRGTAVSIDDGAGSIDVMNVGGDVSIDDGSGSIDVEDVANVKIDDGSGSIGVMQAAGNVSIVDGSGSITVRGVAGSVTVDDGSGSINVSDVQQDFIVIDDGSGGVRWSDVDGRVDAET